MAKILIFFLAVSTFFCSTFGINATVKVSDKKQQNFYGFGTSAAWWAQMVSDDETRQMLADELFSKDGLGINIYRYNVGGGIDPKTNRIGDVSRQTESFLYYNEDSGKYEYDFTRDANAQKMLFAALDRGVVDTVVLFANSPHYSMTKNGETAGSHENTCNIDPKKYDDFVDYFLTVTEYFISKGVPVKYISPINEPQWSWGGDWVGQEGCHYEPDEMVALEARFAQGIIDRGLDVKLMAPESGQLGSSTRDYFKQLSKNPAIKKVIGSYAYHSYWSDTNAEIKMNMGIYRKLQFRQANMDMTEWCELPCKHSVDDINSAVVMARVIANDIDMSRANSWSNWVAVNNVGKDGGKLYSDGLFYTPNGNYNELEKNERYYGYAHFSKFVPVGSVVLESSINKTKNAKLEDQTEGSYFLTNTCAFKTPEGKIVLVIVNEDEAQTIKLDVKAKTIAVYTTDEAHRLQKTYEGEKTKSVSVEKNSITTIVFG